MSQYSFMYPDSYFWCNKARTIEAWHKLYVSRHKRRSLVANDGLLVPISNYTAADTITSNMHYLDKNMS